MYDKFYYVSLSWCIFVLLWLIDWFVDEAHKLVVLSKAKMVHQKLFFFLSVVPLFFPSLLYFLKIAPTVLLFLVKCTLAFRLVCVYSLNLVQFLLLQPVSAAVVYGNIAFNLNHLLTSVKNDNLESVKARSGIFPKILNETRTVTAR